MPDFPALHLFIHFYTTRQATVLHRLSNASTHYNCAQSNSLRLCWGWQSRPKWTLRISRLRQEHERGHCESGEHQRQGTGSDTQPQGHEGRSRYRSDYLPQRQSHSREHPRRAHEDYSPNFFTHAGNSQPDSGCSSTHI